tara:strand:+ start:376 stop:1086 length:711 start_codon:yes stop_codon:yes gene_type:complete
MITIEEWLSLADWKTSFKYNRYSHMNFHWVEYPGWADPLVVLEPKERPLWLVMTRFDGSNPAYLLPDGVGKVSDDDGEWRQIDSDYIISPPLLSIPEFALHANMAFLCVDEEQTLSHLSQVLHSFESHIRLGKEGTEYDGFWNALRELNALFYVSYNGGIVFLSRGDELLEQFLSSDEFARAPGREKARVLEGRLRLWDQLGPNVGPELCVEQGCDMPRIRLAIRCFMHQLKEFRG